MLTREQAIEAAFYSGANLLSFTDPKAHNIDWMLPREGVARNDVKRAAGSYVTRNKEIAAQGGPLGKMLLAGQLGKFLFASDLIEKPTETTLHSWFVFVSVLLAVDELHQVWLLQNGADRIAAAPAPLASASFLEEDDRIDARGDDPLTRADLGNPAPRAFPPQMRPARGKKGN